MPYHHFTPNEQYVIAHLASAGFSLREIGRRLGREGDVGEIATLASFPADTDLHYVLGGRTPGSPRDSL